MRIERTPQSGHFTIVPNATARDHGLSFTARGILAYLLSLPVGRSETVMTLSEKSAEGRKAVSAAMTELEARGYLARIRVRGEAGQITTDVVVFDVRDGASLQAAPNDTSVPVGGPVAGSSVDNPLEDLGKNTNPPTGEPVAAVAASVGEPRRGREGGEISRSETLLADISRSERRLHLGAKDMRQLARLVDQWFGLGADERLIRMTLTAGLPEQISHPVGLLRRRLTDKMPTAPLAAPAVPAQPHGHECSECQRPTRSAGRCGPCTGTAPAAQRATLTGPVNWRSLAKSFGSGRLATA